MPSVYIETTIPSFYYTSRKSVQALAWHQQTRLWWDTIRHSYSLFTSPAVIGELQNAPLERAAIREAMLDDIPRLEVTPEVQRTAAEYIVQSLMPDDGGLDSVHVAVCSHYSIDYLLTWNCTHLANVNKAKHLAVINSRLGLHVPTMVTPYNLL